MSERRATQRIAWPFSVYPSLPDRAALFPSHFSLLTSALLRIAVNFVPRPREPEEVGDDTECDTRPERKPGHLRRNPHRQQPGEHQRQTPLDHHPQSDPEHGPDQRQPGSLKQVGGEDSPLERPQTTQDGYGHDFLADIHVDRAGHADPPEEERRQTHQT